MIPCRVVGCADPNCQRLLALAWQWGVADQARHRRVLLDAFGPATTTRGAGQ